MTPTGRSLLVATALIGASLLLGGCQARAVSRSLDDGYRPLTSLVGLERDRSQKPEHVYKRPGAPGFEEYDHFIIGPVSVDYRDPEMEELSVEAIGRLKRTLITAVTEELEEAGYSVGTRTRPGTMRISFVISGFTADDGGGAINAGSMVAGAVVGVPMLVTIAVGEVTVEGVFTDAYNNRIDAVAIDRAAGARVFNGNPISTWADVESAFNRWARRIREAIDEATGVRG